jgi:uncharacterized protein YdaU (DUF1376 family)
MSQPWMPLYIADYMADTGHLGAAESGAYLHLIMHYWRQGSIPSDDRLLARIAKMTDREWSKAKIVILAFFGPDMKHARIEKELEKAAQKSEARALAGSRGGNAKALNNKKSSVANATILPEQKATDALASSSQPQEIDKSISRAPRKEKRVKTEIASDAQPTDADARLAAERIPPDRFKPEWRKFRGYHIANGIKRVNWHQAWDNWLDRVIEFSARAGPAVNGEKTTILSRLAFPEQFNELPSCQDFPNPPAVTANARVFDFTRQDDGEFGADERRALADRGINIAPRRA